MKKDKKRKKKKCWNRREKDRKKETPETLVSASNIEPSRKQLGKPGYSKVIYYSCNKKCYYTNDYSKSKN